MERRKLIQSLAALPVMFMGKQVGVKYETKLDKNYVVFLNPAIVDVDSFCAPPLPGSPQVLPPGTMVHVVHVGGNQTMDDAIRIYEIEKG